MIIDFSHDVDTYHELLAHYGKWSYTCPVCNSVGEWQRHGSYLRYLIVNEGNLYNIDYNDYKWKTCHMKILRLRCKSCQHTHAILAKDMIPFTVYSIRSIVRIFCYKISNQNIAEAEQRGWVSHQQFYRCVKCFERAIAKLQELNKWDTLVYLKKLPEVLKQQWQNNLKIIATLFDIRQHPPLELSFFEQYNCPLLMQRITTNEYPLFIASFYEE